MVNIICLKWGTKYDSKYVNNLYAGVSKNTTVSYKFHCFTEDTSRLNPDIITHPLPYRNIEGWWHKLYLFSDNLPFAKGEKLFYLDLDTIILSNIDDFLEVTPEALCILRDFYRGGNNSGSAVMCWYHGQYSLIWNSFIKNPKDAMDLVWMNKLIGDQGWIQLCTDFVYYWQDLLPSRVASFKLSAISLFPKSLSILCYHGVPSIPESIESSNVILGRYLVEPQTWLKEHWPND